MKLGYQSGLLSHYKIGDILGKGGFGTVRLANRLADNEKFACKEIRKELDPSIATPEKQQRHLENIQREVAVLKKLRGSLNVVSLEAVYEDDESVYILTECCFGGELIHTIGVRPYSEQTVAKIMKAALRTLAQCHERGILHRDIKPGNFMFLKEGENSPIKAIDFGLAVFYEKDTPREDLGFDGTPWFMAPEVLSSKVVPESDVWSAGVMAYQLLSGFLPFDDKRCPHAPALSEVWKAVLSDEPSFRKRCWTEVSDEAKDFIRKLLQKEPKQRPSAVEALSHEWIKNASVHTKNPNRLSHTIVQRIQRFGQSSLLKRTVLDMIASELLQSYVEKTKYNEKQFLNSHESQSAQNNGGGSLRSQSDAIEIIRGLKLQRRWSSTTDLSINSSLPIDGWEEAKRASRLALDTSHHGSDVMGSFTDLSVLDRQSSIEATPSMPLGFVPRPTELSISPVNPLQLNAVLEEDDLDPQEDENSRCRGQSLVKNLLESRGETVGRMSPDHTAMPAPSLDLRTQRIQQFLASVFGVSSSDEAQRVVDYLNFNLANHVSESELVSGLEKLGYDVDENEMAYLVDIMAPGSTSVNFTQFLASQIDWASLQETHKDAWLSCVRNAFESLDRDKDGTLGSSDIVAAIAEKLPNQSDIDAALDQAKAEACAAELRMSFDDFLSLLKDDGDTSSLRNFDSRLNEVQMS